MMRAQWVDDDGAVRDADYRAGRCACRAKPLCGKARVLRRQLPYGGLTHAGFVCQAFSAIERRYFF